ncbi:DUF4430 domain-containing protein [Miltoncostaea marina]|uniref:DUF4430 domain-containing protein n=1 Tax=Miltoncostaea marina TaxID=2843215 RepID=UPI001C3C609D|nr:DUF4430 domain-containing protein [Miltoncostaea marina]
MLRTTFRATLAAACAAGIAAAPAVALDTTIRVEGSSATLIPESAIPIEGDGVATVFDRAGAAVDVSRASAFWQLYRATSSTGLGLGFESFPAFGAVMVQRVGPDENAGTTGWQYRVNHVGPAVGASDRALAQGDSVLWYYGAADGARELEATPSADRVGAGGTFTVAVTSYGADGAAAPAAGAQVRYGDVAATADAAGRATFVARGAGVRTVVATRAGDIRSAARAVCSFADDPTVCNLPPAAPGAAPAGAGQAAARADDVAPGSRVTRPRLGTRARSVRAIRGVVGADRSDVRRVDVALARRVGSQCRFRARSGGYTAPRPCGRRLFVRARQAGGNWLLPLKKPLAAGSWRVWVRATDGAGNRERVALNRINTGAFRVGDAPRRAGARR